jgi:phosphate transport system protein
MTRQAFDRELRRLQDEVLVLGSMAEKAILDSVAALKRRDVDASRRLIAEDRAINEKRFAIEADCILLIATQQPMAKDLRVLAAVLEIVTELERIADYGKGIAKVTLLIGSEPLVKPLVDIPLMAEKVQNMLHRALDAFVRQDVALARAIPQEDDEVDGLYNQVYRELLTYIITDPRVTEQANHLLWVAHNLERAADRVGNICERTVYTVTGEMLEMDSDDTGF